MTQSPLLNISSTILWLKVLISVVALALLYLRYRKAKSGGISAGSHSLRTRALLVAAVLFSFGVFHNLGEFRGDSFVHHGEMFHYYLGSKYFEELGYYELYNAVIVADAEQGNDLARLPFYTDLRTYQNTPRETALGDAERVRGLFSDARWSAFKGDVAFLKQATGLPRTLDFIFLLMDHGYNGSPISTFILGLLTNAVPVTQLKLLAWLDVLLVVAMGVLVFRSFGFEMGALFSVHFCVNILNAHDYVSGSILRYDWLFYVVAAVCLLEKGRHASSAFFLTLAAMLRVFPAVLFYGIAVTVFRSVRETGSVDRKFIRFGLAAGVTGLALFLLPAVSLGTVLQPWKDFASNTALHDRGVYVNHLGLRGVALFEPSQLSLKKFGEAYGTAPGGDIVRHWQDTKEREYRQKKPIILFSSLLVLLGLTAILWKTKASESESLLWPVLLIYTLSYPAHYYYCFLSLLILLFFRRPNSLRAFVPLCLLWVLNVCALVTDSFRPSPIVFYTLINLYLFVALASIFGFELYTNVLASGPKAAVQGVDPPQAPRRGGKQRKRGRPTRARGK